MNQNLKNSQTKDNSQMDSQTKGNSQMDSQTKLGNPKENNIIIFDTTLRDGEQAAGAAMIYEEKLQIAENLDMMKVDFIEAGFAIASEGDFKAVRDIAKLVKHAGVASLARAVPKDIERAGEAIKFAKHGRIHTFISTSDIHIEHQLKTTKDNILDIISNTVKLARNLCDDVEWSAMDASRSDKEFLFKAIEKAIDAGATTVNIPDTVGYTIPNELANLITEIKHKVPNIDKAIISVHCHNDLGLAVANSLAAVQVGAKQVECTINGLGERAGNASLEELVMILKTRNDILNYNTNVDTTAIAKLSNMVAKASGFFIQNNKAIVGANAFAHASGIHQDGMLKHNNTYEILTPEEVGFTKSNIVMSKHSGRHAFKNKLIELGYDQFVEHEIDEQFARFKELADRKKHIYDEDIIALIYTQMVRKVNKVQYQLKSLDVKTIDQNQSTVEANVTIIDDTQEKSITVTEKGTMLAVFSALKQLTKQIATFDSYSVRSITAGSDSQAEVVVKLLDKENEIFSGTYAHTDTIIASAKAYLIAVNKILNQKEKTTKVKTP